MRIPETSANAGNYYEESAPWQNGVVMDGAGAAGDSHAPHVYPQRPPHAPQPGYMVPPGGAYYPGYGTAPVAPPDDFSDYMWMENEEEFDKQVMQQLEEEALMEQCIEAMLEDERERLNGSSAVPSNGVSRVSLEEQVSKSTLNPLAAEFVPTRSAADSDTASKTEPVEVSANDNLNEKKLDSASETSAETEATTTEEPKAENDSKTDETEKVDDKKTEAKRDKSKDKPKSEVKSVKSEVKSVKSEVKAVKTEAKAVKSEAKAVKSEAKVKDVKPVENKTAASKPTKAKSDVKAAPKKEARSEPGADEARGDSDTAAAPTSAVKVAATESSPSPPTVNAAPKPINYAAAARANKPKKTPE